MASIEHQVSLAAKHILPKAASNTGRQSEKIPQQQAKSSLSKEANAQHADKNVVDNEKDVGVDNSNKESQEDLSFLY